MNSPRNFNEQVVTTMRAALGSGPGIFHQTSFAGDERLYLIESARAPKRTYNKVRRYTRPPRLRLINWRILSIPRMVCPW
jgi:hypothetical protein